MMWAPVAQQRRRHRDRPGVHRACSRPSATSTRPRSRPARSSCSAWARRSGSSLQALVLVPVLRRAGLRLPAAMGLPWRRPRPGQGPREVDAAVRPGQPARLRRDREPGAARRRRRRPASWPTASATRAYANAYLIFILPHSIITVSIVTGLLPRLSREAADGDLAAVRSVAVGGLAAHRRRRRAGRGRPGRARPGAHRDPVLRHLDRGRALHRPGRRGVRARPAGVLGAVHRAARVLRVRGHPDAVPAAGRDRGRPTCSWRWLPTPCCR